MHGWPEDNYEKTQSGPRVLLGGLVGMVVITRLLCSVVIKIDNGLIPATVINAVQMCGSSSIELHRSVVPLREIDRAQ